MKYHDMDLSISPPLFILNPLHVRSLKSKKKGEKATFTWFSFLVALEIHGATQLSLSFSLSHVITY